ncbi:MAG TPA: LacI family transcriptional regulator [Microbacterium sp.]|nr:LacI family transcriptional regulator [Microbacterium sp.]
MSNDRLVVTITDVARRAGVSPATVSRVFNDQFRGNVETAHRVRSAATELSYTPNHLARSFARGKTSAVGFLVPDLANPVFQAVLTGLSLAAGDDGYRVLVADSAESIDDEPLLAGEIRRRCDALVLCAPRMEDDTLAQTVRDLAPVVLTNRSNTVIDAPTLSADSRTGFENIARHLYTLGHRRLAYIEGPEGSANHNRLRGLEDFVRSVEGVSLQRVPGGATSTSGMDAVDALVKTRATAAIAFNDLVGLGVVHGLGERGLRVPDDISVTGFDDIPFARFMTPTLTTASVPHEILGGLAWSRLHALIEGRTPEHNVVFQPRLEARRSTAAPPSA